MRVATILQIDLFKIGILGSEQDQIYQNSLPIHTVICRGLLPDLQADEPWESEAASTGVRRPAVFDAVSGFNMAFAEGPHSQRLSCSESHYRESHSRDSVQVATTAADKDSQFLGELLSRFFHYYARELLWWKDAISIHRVGVSDAKASSAAFFSPTLERTGGAAMAAPASAGASSAGGQTISKSEAWEAMQYAPWVPRYDNGVQLPKLWRLGVIDPFEYTHDLGVVLSEGGMAALNRELSRAAGIICDAAGAEPLDGTQAVSDVVTEHKEQKTNEESQEEKSQEQVGSGSEVCYNTRLARWEVKGLEGVKKVKEISVELLCEEETSKLVARKLGLAEERLRDLRRTKRTAQDDAKAKTASPCEEQLGILAELELEVLLLKSRKDALAKSEKQQQSQQQKAQAEKRRNDRFMPKQPNPRPTGQRTGLDAHIPTHGPGRTQKGNGGRGGRGSGRGAMSRRGAPGAAGNDTWPRLDTTAREQQVNREGTYGRGRGRIRGRGRGGGRDRGRGGETAGRRGARRASAA